MVSMTKRKLLFLVNPISGTRTKEKLIAFLTQQLDAAEISFEIEYTNAAGNYAVLKEQIVAKRITDIIIVGGDGVCQSGSASLCRTAFSFWHFTGRLRQWTR